MKIKILITVLLFSINQVYAQVGVNKTPSSGNTLDVGGTVNVDGNLKFAGAQGNQGDVLMINNLGNPEWNQLAGQFNRNRIFVSPLSPTTGSFTINTTSGSPIMVEVYGSGGGGASAGGGGSGPYSRYIFSGNANGTNAFTFLIGNGGTGAATALGVGTNGISTTLTFNGTTYTTVGGDGASSIGTGQAMNITPPNLTNGLVSFFGLPGNPATKTETTFTQRNATTFMKITKYGNGGDSPNFNIKGANGAYIIENESTAAILSKVLSQSGIYNVGGGGGSNSNLSGNTVTGSNGGNGFLVFYWND